MDFQEQLKQKTDWRQCFCSRPLVDFDRSVNHRIFCNELISNSVRLGGSSHPYCSIWTDTEPARFKMYSSQSFAMDARIRLENLKSRSNSPLSCCAMDGRSYNYTCQKDLWDSEEEEESVLDLVELLDIEDDVEDEEKWLYESPNKQVIDEKKQSALSWCRHVLDNPSPEMEAACRQLSNMLDQRSSSHCYKCPAGCSTQNTSDSLDNNELSISHDSISTNYRLEDITDVHVMARIQEASLRQDYVSTPAAASRWRSPESQPILQTYFNTTVEKSDRFTPGNRPEALSSSRWQPAVVPSLSSSSQQPPASIVKQSCQSPKLARLQQQVAQFKLLKLAQNRGTSPGRASSPLRTSLRSLQAVRNSRSLETDYNPADQIVHPPSGVSSTRVGSNRWSPLLSAASMNTNVRVAAMKRLQRSQSLSPCRIPHPANLSLHRRVFVTSERSATVAWTRNPGSTCR